MLKIKLTLFIVLFLFLNNCGFKVINYSKLNNFKISEIITTGESRINYQLKNYIKTISNDKGDKKISLNLISKSENSIKEKNINNEITKHKIEINTKVEYKILNSKESGKFEFIVAGDYQVNQKYSQTLKNQTQLIKNLTYELSSKIIKELSNRLNDL